MEYKVSEQVRQKFDALVKDEKVQDRKSVV